MYKPNPKLLVKIPARRAEVYCAIMEELGLTKHNSILDLLLSWAETKEGGEWLRAEAARRQFPTAKAVVTPLAAWSK
jgi:tRNA A37 threonylcarbamoyladenosine modification protein TsaB